MKTWIFFKNQAKIYFCFTGSEFLHSLPVIYCSLCDVFLRDGGEAVRHPECSEHISNYKVKLFVIFIITRMQTCSFILLLEFFGTKSQIALLHL